MILDKKSLPFIATSSHVDIDPITKVKHQIETVDISQFDAKLLAHVADRAQHRFTIGTAAPWPEHEMLRTIAEAIERGEQLELVHLDQFYNDWDAAIATDAAMKLPAGTTQILRVDAPSIWSRIGDAWNVLTGKVVV